MIVQEWLGADNQIGLDIWEKKYRHNNETFDEWLYRVSGGDPDVMTLIASKKFLFGGRVLANRGISNSGNYYNCFSAGYVPDDYEGILDMCKEIGVTFKNQGGQGISISKLRPKGTPIGDHYKSDGIIGFMELFNCVTDKTSQGGARKGALMISLDARHKESEDFITIKTNDDKITKANLSLEIDDEFMRAVAKYYQNGEVITLHEKRVYSGHEIEYDIVPIKLYQKMMETVYDWAEPGCLFTNRARNYNFMEFDDNYQIASTNPCGEQTLQEKSSCNLGSLNLYEFIENKFTPEAYFDMNGFKTAIEIALKGLDDVIDENSDRLPPMLSKYKENAENWRNVGLGVFNYAHMLMALGLKYGSKEAIDFTDNLFNMMMLTAMDINIRRAEIHGKFPMCDVEKIATSTIFNNHITDNMYEKFTKHGFRNCSLLSIAPTGSIATMLGGSGGIEPEFQLSYIRKTDNLNESYKIESKVVRDFRKIHGDVELPDYFVTSSDISWRDRIKTQGVIQEHIDTAISSTVNLPNNVTLNEVEHLYLEAWEQGLKGVTVYRDGCKRGGILVTDGEKEPGKTESGCGASLLPRGYVVDVSDDLVGYKRKLNTGCGSIHLEVYSDELTGEPQETFINIGSSGGKLFTASNTQ